MAFISSVIAGCSGGGGSNSATGPTISFPQQVQSKSTFGYVNVAKTALKFNETTTASATFTKTDGSPVPGIQVLFSTTTGILTPANGVVMTDSSGIATIQLTVGNTSGQGQITASASVDNQQVTKIGQFNVILPTLKLANLAFVDKPSNTIDYGSTIGVTVDVTDENGLPYTSTSVDVTFTSTQTALGKATISPSVPTVNGKAAATYKALTAVGLDTITATIAGSAKSINLTINFLSAGSIAFISASPTNIGLKGMGGAGIGETSTVTFKVVDTSGAPKANQPITFTLNTKVGGISMGGSEPIGSGNPVTSSTGPDGTASIIVQSGIYNTPVRVTASTIVNGETKSTQSDNLVISTGVPAQDGFSISMSKFNTESFNYDGETTTITARLSDHFRNPVPNGTAVTFTTSGGSIQPSCVTVAGACSVTWTSQAPRPSSGRVAILAYAVGEEAFTDKNSNGVADPGEFTDTTGAFRDDNENGIWDPATEPAIPFNNPSGYDPADGKYNGVLQGTTSLGAPRSKHVFSNVFHIMGTSTVGSFIPSTYILEPAITSQPTSTALAFMLKDANGNAMPAGTKVVASPNADSPLTWQPGLTDTTPYTVPDSTSNVGTIFAVTMKNASTYTSSENIMFTVTTPKGISTTIPVTFTWTSRLLLSVDNDAPSFSATDKKGANQTINITGGKPPFTVTNNNPVDIAATLTSSGYKYLVSMTLRRDPPTVVAPALPVPINTNISVSDANGAVALITLTYY